VNIPKARNVREISGINHFIFFTSTGLGIINLDQTIIVPPIYDDIRLYCKGYYKATNNKQWDVFNFKGEKTFSTEPPYVNSFFKTVKLISKDNQQECLIDTLLLYSINDEEYHLLTFEGEIIDSNYKLTNDSHLRFEVENSIQKEKLNTKNKEAKIPNENPPFLKEYDQNRVWHYFKNNNVYIVKKNGKWGVVDENNTVIFSITYEEIESESFFLKCTKNKQSFMLDFYGRIYKLN
jgi:hypothetical protein